MNVLVAGGTGFVGRALCAELAERGHDVTAASRSPESARLPAGVEPAVADVTDPDLAPVVEGHDAVVNLVALPSHVQPRGRSHQAVHAEGTRHLLAAAEATDVDRFVQLSALGVDADVDTAYFRAKRRAERHVRESALDWVIYRPSIVFGDGCAFVPFVERIASARVVPLPRGGAMRTRPIWVGDLAPMLAEGVDDASHVGRTYELGGPEVLTLAEIVRLVREDAIVVPVPTPLAAAGSWLADRLRRVPIGVDQYRVFDHDNVPAANDVDAFGAAESSLTTLADYLGNDVPTVPGGAA